MRIGPQPVVTGDNVQNVQQLPLVLVDALDLHIEEAVGIHLDPADDMMTPGPDPLVFQLDGAEAFTKPAVLGKRLQFGQPLEVGDPSWADSLGNQGRQTGIGLIEPAPRGDPVGDVEEPIRENAGKVSEYRGLHQL